jgi:hypothetical protein
MGMEKLPTQQQRGPMAVVSVWVVVVVVVSVVTSVLMRMA